MSLPSVNEKDPCGPVFFVIVQGAGKKSKGQRIKYLEFADLFAESHCNWPTDAVGSAMRRRNWPTDAVGSAMRRRNWPADAVGSAMRRRNWPADVPNSSFCTMLLNNGQNSPFCTTYTDEKQYFGQNSLICTNILHILEYYRANRAFWLIFRHFT
jgi:hypothetical protein